MISKDCGMAKYDYQKYWNSHLIKVITIEHEFIHSLFDLLQLFYSTQRKSLFVSMVVAVIYIPLMMV